MTKHEYTFNGQRPGEIVKEVIPSHPYVIYPAGSRTVLMLFIATAVVLFLPALWYISIPIYLFCVIYFSSAFYSFKETVFIITNHRIFSVAQEGFFKKKISEVDLNKIIDITSETHGFAKTMLKFGDLIVRTAGAKEGGDIVLKNISNPYDVQQRITNFSRYQDPS